MEELGINFTFQWKYANPRSSKSREINAMAEEDLRFAALSFICCPVAHQVQWDLSPVSLAQWKCMLCSLAGVVSASPSSSPADLVRNRFVGSRQKVPRLNRLI